MPLWRAVTLSPMPAALSRTALNPEATLANSASSKVTRGRLFCKLAIGSPLESAAPKRGRSSLATANASSRSALSDEFNAPVAFFHMMKKPATARMNRTIPMIRLPMSTPTSINASGIAPISIIEFPTASGAPSSGAATGVVNSLSSGEAVCSLVSFLNMIPSTY